MKKVMILLVSAMVIFSVNFSLAEEDPMFSFDASVSGYSQYVGGLSGMVFYDDSVIQPSLTLLHDPSGVYANLWGSYSPKDGFDSDYGDEVDYTLGVNRDISSVNLDVYYAYYNCYKLNKNSDGDVHAVGTILTFPEVWTLTPYLEAEYNWVVGASDENGVMYRLGGNFCPIENLTLDISAGGHGEIYGARQEITSFVKYSIAYNLELAEGLVLTPEMNFQKRVGYSERNGGLTKDVVYGGATLSYSF
jgi:hypothetical protein